METVKRIIVLVHGIDDTAKCLHKMAVFFRSKDFTVFEFEYKPNDGSAPLEELAQHLQKFIDEKVLKQTSEREITLIGFSMGGIISRYYVQKLGGDERVKNLITLSSPHRGTIWAYLLRKHGVQQMRPGSKFLQNLNEDVSVFKKVKFISLYTPLDLMIVPAQSSRVDFAELKRVWILAHPFMIRSKRVMEFVCQCLAL